MNTAIWIIVYDLAPADQDSYLAWFHDVHIPEKLARPGYDWAAHYQITRPDGAPRSAHADDAHETSDAAITPRIGYVALFGGTSTRVFLDPSPAQIKPTQTPQTRDMMQKRHGSVAFIASQEWRTTEDSGRDKWDPAKIMLMCGDAKGGDEAFGAHCVQSWLPALQTAAGFVSATKLLASVGPAKHLLLSGFTSPPAETANATPAAPPMPDSYQPLAGTPWLAHRVWPPTDEAFTLHT